MRIIRKNSWNWHVPNNNNNNNTIRPTIEETKNMNKIKKDVIEVDESEEEMTIIKWKILRCITLLLFEAKRTRNMQITNKVIFLHQ